MYQYGQPDPKAEMAAQFAAQNLEPLTKILMEAIDKLELPTRLVGDVEVQKEDGIINLASGYITITASTTEYPRIGGTRTVPCWDVSAWKTYHATRHEPGGVDEAQIGHALNNFSAAAMALNAIMKEMIDIHFQNLGEAEAYASLYDGEEAYF